MKKIFFFLCFFFIGVLYVSADSIQNLEVLNGTLSRKFESANNVYSVVLNENETSLKLNYELKDKDAKVSFLNNEYVQNGENVATLLVTNSNGLEESYTFYLEKEETTPVFNESLLTNNVSEVKEIPYLKYYVALGCLLIILILFKILVIGFKKRKKLKKA